MKPDFEYKGYYGSAEVNVIDNILHGKLMFINDIITYVADSPQHLKTAFKEAVDDYLQTCADLGDTPDTPFKGTFNVRVGQDRHKKAALSACCQGISLNDWLCRAIDAAFAPMPERSITQHVTVNLYANQHHERQLVSNKTPESWSGTVTTPADLHVYH